MSLVKSDERLHMETAVAAVRLAEVVCDEFPRPTKAPPAIQEALTRYRAARHRVAEIHDYHRKESPCSSP